MPKIPPPMRKTRLKWCSHCGCLPKIDDRHTFRISGLLCSSDGFYVRMGCWTSNRVYISLKSDGRLLRKWGGQVTLGLPTSFFGDRKILSDPIGLILVPLERGELAGSFEPTFSDLYLAVMKCRPSKERKVYFIGTDVTKSNWLRLVSHLCSP